jgi:hypothetical protein
VRNTKNQRGQSRHHATAPFQDRGLDDLWITAVEPVAVGQVRETLAAPSVGRVALCARVQEETLPDLAGFGIRCDVLQVHLHELVEHRTETRLRLLLLAVVLTGRRPLVDPGEAAEPGVQRKVDRREHQRDVEQPHPPLGQRIVELLEVAVPRVAHRLDRRSGHVLAGQHLQEHAAGDDAHNSDERHVDAPEPAREITHVVPLSSPRAGRRPVRGDEFLVFERESRRLVELGLPATSPRPDRRCR